MYCYWLHRAGAGGRGTAAEAGEEEVDEVEVMDEEEETNEMMDDFVSWIPHARLHMYAPSLPECSARGRTCTLLFSANPWLSTAIVFMKSRPK